MAAAPHYLENNSSVLIVDDDPHVRCSLVAYCKSIGFIVYEAADGIEALEQFQRQRPTVTVLDIKLPQKGGLELLAEMNKLNQDVPVIMVSGESDMEVVIRALKLGACDFITKPIQDLSVLKTALTRCLTRVNTLYENRRYREHLESEIHAKTTSLITQLSERRKMDRALRRSELRFQSVIENATDIIGTLSFAGEIVSLNSAFMKLTGFKQQAWLGKPLVELIHQDDRFAVLRQLERAFAGFDSSEQECRIRLSDNTFMIGELIASTLIEQKEVVGVLVIIRDITERKQAEREKQQLQMELLQAQKLESIGRLAGGVAHDFNNALTAILGFSELALSELPLQHPVREYVDVIKDAGEKAATLTKQLLAFGRKQILRVEHVCLNTVVLRMGRMLQRLIGDDVLLHLDARAINSIVLADPAQIEQIIMNLVINARDAMQHGGELWISTTNTTLKDDAIKQDGVKPGVFVVLIVRDTGAGMTQEAQSRIFEPFYTTKDPGKGTGLGLATVFGVLSQHHGFISCESKLNQGATFKAYLPVIKSTQLETHVPHAKKEILRGGDETILVVDDEPAIRKLLVRVLKKLGYTLLQASSGEEALEIAHAESIDLLLTDMVMPGINGKVLADRLKAENSHLQTLFMSGYAQQAIDNELALELDKRFIQKPLKPFLVAQKIRELLDEVSGIRY